MSFEAVTADWLLMRLKGAGEQSSNARIAMVREISFGVAATAN